MRYSELPDGAYFAWQGQVYRKIRRGAAVNAATDHILDFHGSHAVEPANRPPADIDLVVQHLKWALTAAYSAKERGTGHSKVVVTLDLDRLTATTSYERENP